LLKSKRTIPVPLFDYKKVFIMHRRSLIQSLAMLGVAAVGFPLTAQAQARLQIEVWKTPTCGCCKDWVAHLQANGFEVKVNDVSESEKALKRRNLGLNEKYGSCHTAVTQGYVVEGHVPAKDIQRLLREKPRAVGLAAPGMPIGSPGMDGPAYGGHKDAYAVLLVQRDAGAMVYQAY
jgi:hypothetical protein